MNEEVFKHPEKFDEDYLRGVVNKLWNTPKFDTNQPSIDIDELKNVIRKSKQG